MVVVTIAGESKELHQVTEKWINQGINPGKEHGLPVCVQVAIDAQGLNMRLSTPGCRNGGGGGRPPTKAERRIFDLWERRGLSSPRFTGGSLISFLRQARLG